MTVVGGFDGELDLQRRRPAGAEQRLQLVADDLDHLLAGAEAASAPPRPERLLADRSTSSCLATETWTSASSSARRTSRSDSLSTDSLIATLPAELLEDALQAI